LIVLAIACVAAWRYYVATPRYAIRMAVLAMQQKDWEMFRRWVDVDAVLSAGIDEYLDRALGEDPQGLALLGQELAERSKPELIRQGRAAVRRQIVAGVPGTQQEGWRAVLVQPRIDGVVVTGDRARANVRFRADVPTMRLRLRKQQGRWRIVAVEDIGAIIGLSMIEEREAAAP
jgi:hypothetical protein